MGRQVLNITSGPAALGPYSVAVEANGLVFLSGQVGLDPAGGERAPDVAGQTHQVLANIGAILGDAGLSMDDIVKTTVFLDDMDDYATVNEIYAQHVGESPPARSAVEVEALPAGFLVEIEVIAARPEANT